MTTLDQVTIDTTFLTVYTPFDALTKEPLIAKAYDYVSDEKHNPSANLPFHGTHHLINVAITAAYFYQQDMSLEKEQDPETIHEVVLAALFHDFNHTGLPDSESDNIERAITGWEAFYTTLGETDRELVSKETVSALIASTRYPYSRPTTQGQSVLISADLFSHLIFALDGGETLGDAGPYVSDTAIRSFVCGLDAEQALSAGTIRSPLTECLERQARFWRSPFSSDDRRWTPTALDWAAKGLILKALNQSAQWVEEHRSDDEFKLIELTWLLHRDQRHPDYEYTFVESARKGDSDPPEGLGWILNPARPFERDDYTDTEYYLRSVDDARRCPTRLRDLPALQLQRYFRHDFLKYLRESLRENRIAGGSSDDGFYSKPEYVDRPDEILSASRAPADIYMLSFSEHSSRAVCDGEPDIFEYHDSGDTPDRKRYGYLCVDMKPWRILVDLARPEEHTYVRNTRYGDHWFPWEYPLPINYYELKALIETYL